MPENTNVELDHQTDDVISELKKQDLNRYNTTPQKQEVRIEPEVQKEQDQRVLVEDPDAKIDNLKLRKWISTVTAWLFLNGPIATLIGLLVALIVWGIVAGFGAVGLGIMSLFSSLSGPVSVITIIAGVVGFLVMIIVMYWTSRKSYRARFKT